MSDRSRKLCVLLIAALVVTSLQGCSRPGTTTPEESGGAAASAVTSAPGERGASHGQAWKRTERQKDCAAEPVELFGAGTNVDVIRYLWQDCNGNGVEDEAGDTYTADYLADGTIDRRVVWRDGETTVDYYAAAGDSIPVFSWYVSDDRWHLTDFSYSQAVDQWTSEHAVGCFAMQKLSRLNNQWYPFGESPFCFYDTDADASPEVALRFCTLYGPEQDANDYSLIWTPLDRRPRPLLCGFRLSFDLENDAGPAQPYSYSLSLTVELLDPIDEAPYLRPLMTAYGRKLNFIPKDAALDLACDVLAGRIPVRKRVGLAHEIVSSGRWEGVIWYQDGVHKIRNAGGPGTRENRLQDFVNCETGRVRLYASSYDGLVHLLRADHSVIRRNHRRVVYSDSDGDGYADLIVDGDTVVHVGRDSFSDLSVEELVQASGVSPQQR